MGLDFQYIHGQTPLDPDEIEGLLIDSIATRGELDEFEQQNIEEAMQWVLTRSLKKEQVLTKKFIRQLHFRMYGSVWDWAGDFRNTEKNIGISRWEIGYPYDFLSFLTVIQVHFASKDVKDEIDSVTLLKKSD